MWQKPALGQDNFSSVLPKLTLSKGRNSVRLIIKVTCLIDFTSALRATEILCEDKFGKCKV